MCQCCPKWFGRGFGFYETKGQCYIYVIVGYWNKSDFLVKVNGVHMKNYRFIQERIEFKRFLRRLRSKYIKKLRNGGKISRLMSKKLHIKNKAFLYKKMGAFRKRELYNIKVPKIFDLSTDPDLVLSYLDKLKKDLNHKTAYDLHVDHSDTEIIDLDASFLFDRLIKDYSKYWARLHIKIRISGKASVHTEVNNFLLSFGLLNELNITHHNLFPDKADKDYSDKYITYKKRGTSDKKYLAGNASTELVNYFNKCFIENNFKIIDEAKTSLMDCFGEIIKNAEEHSGRKQTEWTVLGCYNKTTHSCSFSIINHGNSFYQSLAENESTAKEILKEVSDVIYSHNNVMKKLTIDRNLYEQSIWTYMAIQDGISSKRSESGKASTRGQGIMDVVQFIDQIRNKENHETHLCIISGNTFLNIDYEYSVIEKKIGKNQETRRFIYFNKDGNLSSPPDLKKLKPIKIRFPGVIFSGYFTIDENYLFSQMRSA